jgi:hypothetical protein
MRLYDMRLSNMDTLCVGEVELADSHEQTPRDRAGVPV